MMTIALAVTTFTGQNAGARNLSRIKEGHKVALKMAEIGTLILALPALCFAPEIVRIFNTDPDVVYYGTLFIRTNCWFALFACLNQVYAGRYNNDLYLSSVADASDGQLNEGVVITNFFLGGIYTVEYLYTTDYSINLSQYFGVV